MPRPREHVFVCSQSRPPGHPRGSCDHGSNVVVYPEGVMYNKVTKDDVAAIFDEHLPGGKPVARLQASAEVWG